METVLIKSELIKAAIADMVGDFLDYDRRNDEELESGDIEASIKAGLITENGIVDMLRKELHDQLT